MASYLLYAATLLPLLLIVLAVHEAGHFWVARRLKMHAAGFQIGLGPALYTRYCGRVRIRLPAAGGAAPSLPAYNRAGAAPVVGDRAALAVQADPANPKQLQALAWLPAHKQDWPARPETKKKDAANTANAASPGPNPELNPEPDPAETDGLPAETARRLDAAAAAQRLAQEQPLLQGMLLALDEKEALLAPVAFTLRPIPIAAGVMLPEDPSGQAPGFYNNAGWLARSAVIAAGPIANLLLMFLALILLTLLPPPNLRLEILTVQAVAPGSPAQEAGFLPGDRITYAGETRILPSLAHIQEVRNAAYRAGRDWKLHVARGQQNHTLTLPPLPPGELLGLTLRAEPANRRSYPRTPGEAMARFARLNRTYYEAFAQLAHFNQDTLDNIASPVMVTHQLGQVLPRAGWPAWLAVLAAVSLTAGLLNLLPVPPMDGYRLTAETVRSLRGGKTLNPRLEGIMLFYGAALIILASLYLVFRDVLRIAEF